MHINASSFYDGTTLEKIDGLTVNSYNKLKMLFNKRFKGITDVQALHNISITELAKIDGVGRKTLENIELSLQKYGIKMKP